MTLQRKTVVSLLAFGIALGAAPQNAEVPVEEAPYHVPAFRNELVTVLNVFIPPGRESGFHRHSLDSVGVLVNDTDRTGQVLGAEATVTPRRGRGSANFTGYSSEPLVHSVAVTGNAPFHNIVVELLYPDAGRFTAGTRGAGYAQLLDNERVRVWRLALEPGQSAAAITQSAPGVRVVIEGGEIVESVPGKPDRAKAPRSGDFFWQDAGETRAVRNVGATRIEIVELELK
jgi:quercetin dioxygenase-like cupin family protein